MIKKGVIDEDTPNPDRYDLREVEDGQPTTKQAADALEQHLLTDAIDAVAARSKRRRP